MECASQYTAYTDIFGNTLERLQLIKKLRQLEDDGEKKKAEELYAAGLAPKVRHM